MSLDSGRLSDVPVWLTTSVRGGKADIAVIRLEKHGGSYQSSFALTHCSGSLSDESNIAASKA
jgi:hypothetical protein